MTVELKRMFQRRGLKADLPLTPENGEIYLTIDTEEMLIGVNGNYLKLTTFKDIVDDFITDSPTLPLSARQGLILHQKIGSLENFVEMYKTQIDELINNHIPQIDTNTAKLEDIQTQLLELQNNVLSEIPIISADEAPTNKELMWYDTKI